MTQERKNKLQTVLASCTLIIGIIALFVDNRYFIGIGSGIIGVSISFIFSGIYYLKHPEVEIEKNINVHDERSVLIKDKSKAMIYNFDTYFLLPSMMILSTIMSWPKEIVYIIIGIYILRITGVVIFFNRYNNIY